MLPTFVLTVAWTGRNVVLRNVYCFKVWVTGPVTTNGAGYISSLSDTYIYRSRHVVVCGDSYFVLRLPPREL